MSKHPALDELSAHVDGHARDPEHLMRHLAACPACARRHQELAALSRHIKDIPLPEVRPEFLTRVMAGVRERDEVLRPWWRPWPVPVLAAALVVLLAASAFLVQQALPARPEKGPVAEEKRGLLARQEYVKPAAGPAESWDAGFTSEMDSSEDLTPGDMLGALADSDWFAQLAYVWDQDRDLDELLSAMTKEEAETLEGLVQELTTEGQRI